MAQGSDQKAASLTLTKMCLGADYYSNISPAITRSQMNDVYRIKHYMETADPTGTSCPFCGQIYRPDNHTARIQPRLRLNKKIKKLLKKDTPLKRHSFQAHLLENYKAGFNMMVKKCNACGKANKYKLYSREERKKFLQSKAPIHDEPVKLSKSQKKKLKAKQKQREKQKPGISIGESPSTLKPLDAILSPESQPSSSTTLKNESPSLTVIERGKVQQPKNSPHLSGKSNIKDYKSASSVNTESKGVKRLKGKKTFNTLQNMLNDAKLDKMKKDGSPGSALQNFLGSL